MATRLFVNLSQVYLPLWLQDNLQLGATSVATTPLALFVSGFLTSLAMGPLTQVVGRKVTVRWQLLLNRNILNIPFPA